MKGMKKMQWLKEENDTLISPPHNDPETGTMNCHLNEQWLVSHGFRQWTDEEIEAWQEAHQPPKPPVSLEQLTELTYRAKAAVAYGGLTFIKNGVSYHFDTDADSITMCNGQIIAMASQPDDFIVNWKVYIDDHPTLLAMTKAEFLAVYGFGMQMINAAFGVEGTLNGA